MVAYSSIITDLTFSCHWIWLRWIFIFWSSSIMHCNWPISSKFAIACRLRRSFMWSISTFESLSCIRMCWLLSACSCTLLANSALISVSRRSFISTLKASDAELDAPTLVFAFLGLAGRWNSDGNFHLHGVAVPTHRPCLVLVWGRRQSLL